MHQAAHKCCCRCSGSNAKSGCVAGRASGFGDVAAHAYVFHAWMGLF